MAKIKMDDILDGKYDMDVVQKQTIKSFVDDVRCFNHHSQKTKDLLLEYIADHWDKVYVKSLADEEMILIIK
jgi:hypothetical protein